MIYRAGRLNLHAGCYITTSGTAVTGSGYSPDGTLPAGAVVCSQAEAEAAGPWSTIVDGALVVGEPPAGSPTLAQRRTAACVQIDQGAEAARLTFLTPGALQARVRKHPARGGGRACDAGSSRPRSLP